jgi:hypothetical protein
MSRIPDALFAQMLPRATAWAEMQARHILERGIGLSERGIEVARHAGVQHPERVRLLPVATIPIPEEADLRQAAQEFGLITQQTAGLTIGYGIFVLQNCSNDAKLVAHELMHVAQCENSGGIPGFLVKYLSEVNEYGYPEAPMEQQAIAFAESEFPSRD